MAKPQNPEEEKKELPPIEEVACSEKVFVEEKVEKAWLEIKEEFKLEPKKEEEKKEGKPAKDKKEKPFKEKKPKYILNKAQVQKWWEKSLAREPFTEQTFTPLFNEIPKAEEGKDDVKQKHALEHLIQRAIEIKLVPTRLHTHMDEFHEMF